MGAAVLLACSGDKSGDRGGDAPCVDGDDRCGTSCSAMQPCSAGLYCANNGECAKDCDDGNPCSGGGMCAPDGTCRGGSGVGSDAGVIPGGRAGSDAPGTAGASGAAGTGTAGGTRPDSCADVVVQTTRVTPTVILIVDQSSSMDEEFDNGTRWNVLRDFLLEENGLIEDLQSQVHFGLALYSAESGGMNPEPIGECPMVTTVAPAANNYAAIEQAYRAAEPIEDTPTGDSIDRIIDDLDLGTDPDNEQDPVVFVLATDGEPDQCESLDPQNGQAEAIAAVERAYGLGIRTFVISVGDELSVEHQQDIANAGLGRGAGDEPAEYWVAGNDQTLRDALTSIIGGQLGCEITLNGQVDGDACLGRVELNGDPLGCNDDNGWELVDENHIRLLGSACDQLKSGADVFLDVSFPCGVVTPD
jgi:hypothetical protein